MSDIETKFCYQYDDCGDGIITNCNNDYYEYDSFNGHRLIIFDNVAYVEFINRFVGIMEQDIIKYYQLLQHYDFLNDEIYNDFNKLGYIDIAVFTSNDMETIHIKNIERDNFRDKCEHVKKNEKIRDKIFAIPGSKEEIEYFNVGPYKLYYDKFYIYYPLLFNNVKNVFTPYILSYVLSLTIIPPVDEHPLYHENNCVIPFDIMKYPKEEQIILLKKLFTSVDDSYDYFGMILEYKEFDILDSIFKIVFETGEPLFVDDLCKAINEVLINDEDDYNDWFISFMETYKEQLIKLNSEYKNKTPTINILFNKLEIIQNDK